jgi:hypothetical protein
VMLESLSEDVLALFVASQECEPRISPFGGASHSDDLHR